MTFREQVFLIVTKIPYGQVASYGQVAALAGKPRGAREVGWALASCRTGTTIPWWRVVNRHGYLSIRNDDISAKLTQKSLLEQEGIVVNQDLEIDLEKFRWKSLT